MAIEIEVTDVQDVRVLVVTGQINSRTAITLGERLQDAAKRNKYQIVLDLEGVDYITSAGLREILSGIKVAQSNGGDLRVCVLQEPVVELFKMTGLGKHIKAYATRDEAVESFA